MEAANRHQTITATNIAKTQTQSHLSMQVPSHQRVVADADALVGLFSVNQGVILHGSLVPIFLVKKLYLSNLHSLLVIG